VLVRYLGAQPVRVRGTASGRIYHTSSAAPTLAIDARDAAALIRTGLFRAAAGGTAASAAGGMTASGTAARGTTASAA
jgi:hypothetical protein